MTNAELREVLLVEAHRILHQAAAKTVAKIGQPIPEAARPDYLSQDELSQLQHVGMAELDHPLMQKWMQAQAARMQVLEYPPKEVLSPSELDALAAMRLSEPERSALERLIAEACATTLFHFFCLLDSVGDPELKETPSWGGADFVGPRQEGPFLHDEFYEKYWVYDDLNRA
jgi:hypothetical protein